MFELFRVLLAGLVGAVGTVGAAGVADSVCAVGGCGVVEDGEGDVDEVISSDDDEAFNVFDHCVDAMAKVSESDEDG